MLHLRPCQHHQCSSKSSEYNLTLQNEYHRNPSPLCVQSKWLRNAMHNTYVHSATVIIGMWIFSCSKGAPNTSMTSPVDYHEVIIGMLIGCWKDDRSIEQTYKWSLQSLQHFAHHKLHQAHKRAKGCTIKGVIEEVAYWYSQSSKVSFLPISVLLSVGPHVNRTLFLWCKPHTSHTDVNTGVRTTFRHDNINGQGEGALVLATAIPQAKRRSARKVLPTVWPPSLRRTRFCHNEYSRCTNETCNIPCVSYQVVAKLHEHNIRPIMRSWHNESVRVLVPLVTSIVHNTYIVR